MVHLTLQYLKFTHFVKLELFIRQFIKSRLIFIGQLAEDVCLKSLNCFAKEKSHHFVNFGQRTDCNQYYPEVH